MEFKAVGDRLIVRLIASEETKGGVLLPARMKERPILAEVVSIGAGRLGTDEKLCRPSIRIGDVVLLPPWAGTAIEEEGLKIVMEDEVLAVVGR